MVLRWSICALMADFWPGVDAGAVIVGPMAASRLAENGSTKSIVCDGAAQESNLPSVGLPRLTGFEDR